MKFLISSLLKHRAVALLFLIFMLINVSSVYATETSENFRDLEPEPVEFLEEAEPYEPPKTLTLEDQKQLLRIPEEVSIVFLGMGTYPQTVPSARAFYTLAKTRSSNGYEPPADLTGAEMIRNTYTRLTSALHNAKLHVRSRNKATLEFEKTDLVPKWSNDQLTYSVNFILKNEQCCGANLNSKAVFQIHPTVEAPDSLEIAYLRFLNGADNVLISDLPSHVKELSIEALQEGVNLTIGIPEKQFQLFFNNQSSESLEELQQRLTVTYLGQISISKENEVELRKIHGTSMELTDPEETKLLNLTCSLSEKVPFLTRVERLLFVQELIETELLALVEDIEQEELENSSEDLKEPSQMGQKLVTEDSTSANPPVATQTTSQEASKSFKNDSIDSTNAD